MTSTPPPLPYSWTADPLRAGLAWLFLRRQRLIVGLAVVMAGLQMWSVIRSGWICDDGYINLRTVQNFALGHGLRWNPAERVQSFTSPLWLLIFALFHSIVLPSPLAVYFSTLCFSFVLSFAASAILVFAVARGGRGRLLVIAGLFGSKALIEFSSGGLENPLSHLLLAWFCALWLSPREKPYGPFWIGFAGCMVCLCRLDLSLIVAPVLALELWERRDWRTVGLFGLAFTPLLAWEAFSLIYYGFPFPNTAYAKLAAPIGAMIRLREGVAYFWNSIRWDFPTLTTLGLGLALAAASRDRRRMALAAGIALYLIYILRIGGDFMSGRMFTAPLVVALALLGRWEGRMGDRWPAKLFIAAMILSPLHPLHPLRTGIAYYWLYAGRKDVHQIADERSWYYQSTGLMLWQPGYRFPRHDWAEEGKKERLAHGDAPYVVVRGAIGYYGFFAGPNAMIVDHFALSDPLLARLPPNDEPFRPGHLKREIPDGYVDTLRTGVNVIRDPKIARLYDDLALLTRGPLWKRERWRAILRLNSGRDRAY